MEIKKDGVFELMSFTRDFKQAIKVSIIFFIIVFILLLPLSNFFELPDFLWFLENKSLLTYLNQYAPQIISMFTFFGVVLLALTIWKKKK